jgi:ubiquinone/menaquinone biosynthesis C-methylase UbiE
MGIYEKYVMPKLVHYTCGLKPTMKQREKVVPLAEGRVLEIGIGSGLNIPFYAAHKIKHLWGLDPSSEMWSIARKNAAQHHIDVEFIQSGAEAIPLDSNSADTVVMTYTMCTIPEVRSALDEIRRVLKPGGKLVFCEHGLAPDKDVQRWQNRLNPAWKILGGGCNLNRPIPQLLQQSGFKTTDMQTMYIPGWKPGCFNYWGTATHN